MTEDTLKLYKRFKDLSARSYLNSQYTFTPFLSMGELSDFYDQTRLPNSNDLSLSPSGYTIYGGYSSCERAMIRFGNEDDLMYNQPFPIVCIRISPLNEKFSDNLTHRDYLGALMNLSIDRSLIGDIVIKDKLCYCFVDENIAPLICSELTRIKHTTVMCEECNSPDILLTPKFEDMLIQAKSLRIDGIVAKITKLSRSKTAELFIAKKIYVNGHLIQNESHNLKPDDIISVRGYGKFIFKETSGTTKKGNLNITISKYV